MPLFIELQAYNFNIINIIHIAIPVCWPPVSHPYLYITIGVADNQEGKRWFY